METMKLTLYQVPQLNTIRELLDHCTRGTQTEPVFFYADESGMAEISKEQFRRDVEGLANWILDKGMYRKNLALIGGNSYQWLLTYFAVTCSGNVCVTLDKDMLEEEIRYIIEQSQSEMVFCSDEYFDKTECLKDCKELKQIINMNDLSALASENTEDRFKGTEAAEKDLAAIVYTSGTTGNSKGVMLTHGNLIHNTVMSCETVKYEGTTMAVLPFHHTLGLNAGVFAALLHDSPVFINQSLRYLLRDYALCRPVQIVVVPMFLGLFAKKIKEAVQTSGEGAVAAFRGNLKILISGGAKVDPSFEKMFRDWGIAVLDGYGITECSPVVSVNRVTYYRDGSAGPLLPGIEARIYEPNEAGEGELQLKGPMVMQGYYKNPKATEDTFLDGWFRTGDIARIDEDGFLFISGRIKNLIILSNGKNIYPEELEDFFNKSSLIMDMMVLEKENTLAAIVLPDPERLKDMSAEELKNAIRNEIKEKNRQLPNFKHIQKVYFRSQDFIRTSTKKIRRSVKENYICEE